jgi:PAS domain S-box-containing protein
MQAPLGVPELVDQLRMQQERLRTLRHAVSADSADDLAATIDEIGEHLLVADEELRVQGEQLSLSTSSLQRTVQAYEELFDNAPVGYVQTDGDGAIVRVNRAATELAMLHTWPGRPHTMVSLFRPEDRAAVRRAITFSRRRMRQSADAAMSEAVECALVRPDGSVLPVVLSVRPSHDGMTGNTLLHWELRTSGSVDADLRSAHPAVRMREVSSADESDPQPRRLPTPRLTEAMADAARDFAEQVTAEELLLDVLERAVVIFPACDQASITRMGKGARFKTTATLSASADACDELQGALHEGPSLTAITEHRVVRVGSASKDLRWPRFAEGAAEHGVGSILAIPLSPRGVNAALSLYAAAEEAFDDEDEVIGRAFAIHAGIALAHAELEANLRTALQSRECIGQAVGILMERHRITASQAFDLLVYASQRTHRKLRDLAKWVVATGEDPNRLVRHAKRTESPAS